MSKLKAALAYLKHGFAVIPIKPSMEKKPLLNWKPYQQRLPTIKEVTQWWKKWPNANLAILTGRVSNLYVIDVDDADALAFLSKYLPKNEPIPCVQTPKGGYHYWFKYPENLNLGNTTGIVYPKIDTRGEGGYVLVPPSVIEEPDPVYGEKYVGQKYVWLSTGQLKEGKLPHLTKEFLDLLLKPQKIKLEAKEEDEPRKIYITFNNKNKIPEGTRDNALFHIANQLIKAKTPVEEVTKILLNIALYGCDPPFPEREAIRKVESAIKRAEETKILYMEEVRNFIENSSGIITTTDLYRHLNVSSRRAKKTIVECLRRLERQGVIKKTGRRAGEYRIVEQDIEFVDWKKAELKIVNFWLPLNMHKAIDVIPGSIIAIAGMQNAGKTAWAMNIAYHNQKNFETIYFSSEITPAEFNERAKRYTDLQNWNVKFAEVTNMAVIEDYIKPDALNIIDYLEPPNADYTIMAQKLADIHRRLREGIAVVCLQKKSDSVGAGGEYMKNKPHLYITLDVLFKKGICKATIIKCKKPKYGYKNPQGLEAQYRISLKNGVAIEEIAGFKFEKWLQDDLVNEDEKIEF